MSTGEPRRPFLSPVLRMWVVSHYDDVVTALKNPRVFSSAQLYEQGAAFMQLAPEAEEVANAVVPMSTPHMAVADPPQHTRLRGCATRSFTPKRLASFEPAIRRLADGLIDEFVALGQVDIADKFTIPLPVLSVLLHIGVPQDDMPQIRQWYSDWTMLMLSRTTPEQQIAYAHSLQQFHAYLMDLVEQRRAKPREDLTSDLVAAMDDGTAELNQKELVNLLSQLIGAGSQTTTDSLNTALSLLLSDPQKWHRIREDSDWVTSAVEEALRCTRALRGPMRATTEEVTLGGVVIPKGARVYLMHTVANRDGAQFSDPNEFCPQRSELNQHIAFGHGIHRCLGEWLARLEMKVGLEALSARIPDMRLLTEQDDRVRESAVVRSRVSLSVAWGANEAPQP